MFKKKNIIMATFPFWTHLWLQKHALTNTSFGRDTHSLNNRWCRSLDKHAFFYSCFLDKNILKIGKNYRKIVSFVEVEEPPKEETEF